MPRTPTKGVPLPAPRAGVVKHNMPCAAAEWSYKMFGCNNNNNVLWLIIILVILFGCGNGCGSICGNNCCGNNCCDNNNCCC